MEMARWTDREKHESPGRQRVDKESQTAAWREGWAKRVEAFAPALYRTEDCAITRVLAARPSAWPVLALLSNTLLPSRPPAPH